MAAVLRLPFDVWLYTKDVNNSQLILWILKWFLFMMKMWLFRSFRLASNSFVQYCHQNKIDKSNFHRKWYFWPPHWMFSCKKNSSFIFGHQTPRHIIYDHNSDTSPSLYPCRVWLWNEFHYYCRQHPNTHRSSVQKGDTGKSLLPSTHFLRGIFTSVFSNSHHSKYFALKKAPSDLTSWSWYLQ